MVEIKNSPYDEESSTESERDEQLSSLDGSNIIARNSNQCTRTSTEDSEGYTIVDDTVQHSFQAEVICKATSSAVPSTVVTEPGSQGSCCVGVTETQPKKENNSKTVGAGIAGAVVALPFGLFPAAAIGLGAAYGCKRDDALGDVCRAAGDVACVAGTKAQEVNSKHQIVKRVQAKLNDVNEKHGIFDKLQHVFGKVQSFEVKHGVIHKALAGVESILKYAAEKIRGRKESTAEEE